MDIRTFDLNIFSNRLKMLRLTRGNSRAHISEKTGIPVSSVGNYERGDKVPGADILKLLCEYYQVPADYLLGRINEEQIALPWPSSIPVNAVPDVESIKRSVDTMLSNITHSTFGLSTFKLYAKIFELLPEIDSFATQKLHELQCDYPEFRNFGAESEMYFDEKPLLLALADGCEKAIEFAKRLTSTMSEIKNKIFEIKDNIDFVLTSQITDAIQGRPVDNITRRNINQQIQSPNE